MRSAIRRTDNYGFQGRSRPDRILMTADTVGGVWHYALELAGGLAAQGIEVTLATMGGRTSLAQRKCAEEVRGLRVIESDFRLEWMAEPWPDVEAAGDWLLEIARDVEPDLVHLNNYAHGHLPWNCPVLMVGHSCVYSWYNGVRGSDPPPPEWDRYRAVVAEGLAAADAVTAPTAAMLHALELHYGHFKSWIPIHNGLDVGDFTSRRKEPMVFGAGRVWDDAKNLAALDAVADDLPWPVFVAGATDHPDGGCLEFHRAQQLGVLDRDEVKRWFSRAAIYALPARYEPFGLSALEAALSGCALVLGDIPSLREVWGDAATYVDPNDPASLRNAIGNLIEDSAHRAHQSARASGRAKRYTRDRMLRAYMATYERLLATEMSSRRTAAGVRPRPAPRAAALAARHEN